MQNSKDHSSELVNVRKLIDMVVMLKDKTSGNLSKELDQIQEMMLSELELKYKQKINKSFVSGKNEWPVILKPCFSP